ncbi:MAG: methionine--tRNA ligase [Anaerolineae bacterium]|nr:methionine--tRNA ligase [Anaerolineae bacterium]
MSDPFYITTPIYYVNDAPHLGHAYTTVLADVLARFARLRGRDAFFLTGTDEHGLKVQLAAQKRNIAPQDYSDIMQAQFRSTWEKLGISYDDFIRTTQQRHVKVVQQVLNDLWQRGEIYLGGYEGWYCVHDERFWTFKDLLEGKCPDCGRPVEKVVEANYFFRMSTYQDWLIDYIKSHPDFIQPAYRRNEVLGFLRQPLADLCISRPINRLTWGIPLPFDKQFVTYVWFDALLNYITAAGYGQANSQFDQFWPQAIHLIGKDILTTHSVYWPIMLKAMNLPMPRTIFAHGWWVTHQGQKMSKSLGNAVAPLDLVDIYGVDAFRYFLMRDMTPGLDADFSEDRLAERYRYDLSNNLGNLVQRVASMSQRYFNGQLSAPGPITSDDEHLCRLFESLPERTFAQIDAYNPQQALILIMEALNDANQYLELTAPWKLAVTGQLDRTGSILYNAAEAVRIASILLWPVMPEKCYSIWQLFNWTPPQPYHYALVWGKLQPGTKLNSPSPLFPRLEMMTA